MNCLEMETLLPLYWSGELDDAARAQLHEHAGNCPECALELRLQKKYDDLLVKELLCHHIDDARIKREVRAQIAAEAMSAKGAFEMGNCGLENLENHGGGNDGLGNNWLKNESATNRDNGAPSEGLNVKPWNIKTRISKIKMDEPRRRRTTGLPHHWSTVAVPALSALVLFLVWMNLNERTAPRTSGHSGHTISRNNSNNNPPVSQPETTLYADAADDHYEEVVQRLSREWTDRPEAIDSMVKDAVGNSTVLAELAPVGYHVNRVRICELGLRNYLHLVYTNGKQDLSIFLRVRHDEKLEGAAVTNVRGTAVYEHTIDHLHVAAFQSPRYTVLLVAGDSQKQVLDFACKAADSVVSGLSQTTAGHT